MSSLMKANRVLSEVPAVSTAAPLPRLRRSPVPKHEPRSASRVFRSQRSTPSIYVQGTLALALPRRPRPDGRRWTGTGARPRSGAKIKPSRAVARAESVGRYVRSGRHGSGGRAPLRRAVGAVDHPRGARDPGPPRRSDRSGTARRRSYLKASGASRCRVFTTARDLRGERSHCRAGTRTSRGFRMEGLHGRWRVTELEIG